MEYFDVWKKENKFRSEEQEQKVKRLLQEQEIVEEQSEEEFGDFQTPFSFAIEICEFLKNEYGIHPTLLIEPTYGKGNFIVSGYHTFESIKQIYGVELQGKYETYGLYHFIKNKIPPHLIHLHRDNFLQHEIKIPASVDDNILIIGNPPWVTNSKLSVLNSDNLPEKTNFKKEKGIDALLGKSNFDISEVIILKTIRFMKERKGHVVMICKESIIPSLMKQMKREQLIAGDMKVFRINAASIFGVSCDACVLFISFLERNTILEQCEVWDWHEKKKIKTIGFHNNQVIMDINMYNEVQMLDGKFPFIWRQGIKHDASKVMEWTIQQDGVLRNGFGECLVNDSPYLYPLLKSSDLKGGVCRGTRKKVIVTQKFLGENTDSIKEQDKALWEYLCRHADVLNQRKSKIYKEKPFASIFGVGDYAFTPYKIALSGFYKEPMFTLVMPINNKPVMLDDTCYFVGFENPVEAGILYVLLRDSKCKKFLHSTAMLQSKRPFTKEQLSRLDIRSLVNEYTPSQIQKVWDEIEYPFQITENEYKKFSNKLTPLSI